MNKPTVSIITVCYNSEQTIERTLRSVAVQTYPHIEYIVVDGASKDGTLALVERIMPTAKVLSEPDRGIYDAMNKGLGMATGHYVWYLNSGDALAEADTVQRLFADVCTDGTSPMPDVLYGDTRLIDGSGQDMGLRRLRPPVHLSWRSFLMGMTVCHQSFVARRAICPQYDERYRFSADVDWCIRVMKKAQHYLRSEQVLSLYLNEGATTANHRRSLLERFDVMRRHYGLLPTLGAHLVFLVWRRR